MDKHRQVITALMLYLAVGAHAAVLTLQQGRDGYNGTVDATIFDTDTANSAGEYPYLYVGMTQNRGARRALISFDLSSISTASTVTSATLQFYIEPELSRSDVIQGAVHKMTKAWTEGGNQLVGNSGGTGSPAQPGDTTWSHVSYDTLPWTTPGADFAASASGTGTFGAPGSYVIISGAGLTADVQSWVTAPSTNFGWAVLGDESLAGTAKRFYSSESPELEKPILYVEFTPPSIIGDWFLY